MNITLIGMAGAGKSYVGERLADKLDLEFVDIDDVLEAQRGKSLQEILEEVGERKYLDLEAHALIARTRGRDNMLVSPGGSIIYRNAAMDHLKDISTVVYLKVPFRIIEERKKDAPPRAIIGLGKKTLRQLYDERHPLYESHADFVVETENLDMESILDAIVDHFGFDVDEK